MNTQWKITRLEFGLTKQLTKLRLTSHHIHQKQLPIHMCLLSYPACTEHMYAYNLNANVNAHVNVM